MPEEKTTTEELAERTVALATEIEKARVAIAEFSKEIDRELREKLVQRDPLLKEHLQKDNALPLRLVYEKDKDHDIITIDIITIYVAQKENEVFAELRFNPRDADMWNVARKWVIANELASTVAAPIPGHLDPVAKNEMLVSQAAALRERYSGENRDFLRSHPDSFTTKVFTALENALNAIGKLLSWKEFTFSKDKRGVEFARKLDSVNLATNPHTMHSTRKEGGKGDAEKLGSGHTHKPKQ